MTPYQILRFPRSSAWRVVAGTVSRIYQQRARSLRVADALRRLGVPLQFPEVPPEAQRRQLR